jgi:hypothetical protein
MSEFDTLDILGLYAEDYTEPETLPAAHLVCGETSVTFSRQPGYGEFELIFHGAVEKAGGGTLVAYPPIIQEMILRQPLRINGASKTDLESFFNVTVRGIAETFTYNNANIGPALTVRFAEPTLPAFEEVGFDQYAAELALRIAVNYPQLDPSTYPGTAYSGNRFTLGTAEIRMPLPLRSGSGHETERRQSLQRDSAAGHIAYERSRTYQKKHQYPVILTAAQFVDLQAFFFTFVHGRHRQFTWTDENATARTMRLGADRIKVKQLGINRFSTDLPLLEEVAV